MSEAGPDRNGGVSSIWGVLGVSVIVAVTVFLSTESVLVAAGAGLFMSVVGYAMVRFRSR